MSSCQSIGRTVLAAYPLERQDTYGNILESETVEERDPMDPDRFYEFFTYIYIN